MKDSETILKNEKFQNFKYENVKTMTNHEELVGGCCVCSDDQGFSNNALVYCDGKNCAVACHTACYGIVSIPDGDWFCRRCETGENQASCRLCPLTEGAMKRTSDNGWAHVVCALYIPEVSFGDDTTMEPIILTKVPSTRYEQICSICIKNGRSMSYAKTGACCECTVKNCSQLFHVTCAQQAGLLFEDVRKNNCQYPIYCEQHQPKFSKFIRQIPAFQYKLSERKRVKEFCFISQNSKEKTNLSQLSDFVHKNENSTKSNNEINSLTNLSQFIDLNKEDQTSLSSSNQNNRKLSTDNTNSKQQSIISSSSNNSSNDNINLSSKIKIEENDKNSIHINKKRHHSNEGISRPVGRPPSKKTSLFQKKIDNPSNSLDNNVKNEESSKPIEFYPRRPLTNSLIKSSTEQNSFPPKTLEEFLEQEWESTSDFILQQSMPHDVSSLLSCLYQFKSENASLQTKFEELKHRRDSLRITNANLRRKLSEILTINNNLSCLPINKQIQSPIDEKPSRSEMDFLSTNPTTLSCQTISPYGMIKSERMVPTNGLSLELLSQILTTNGPQLFAPTWNISNFGYANFPGANSISISDESIIRSYATSFEQ